jgi:hypothetical protein
VETRAGSVGPGGATGGDGWRAAVGMAWEWGRTVTPPRDQVQQVNGPLFLPAKSGRKATRFLFGVRCGCEWGQRGCVVGVRQPRF